MTRRTNSPSSAKCAVTRSVPLIIAVVIVTVICPPTSAGDPIVRARPETIFIHVPAEKGRGEWSLGLIDGKLGFYAKRQGGEDQKNLPSIPSDKGMMRMAFRFLKRGDTLLLEVTPDEQARSNVQAEKHHWFLTGSSPNKGGEVPLTREETKYSHWEFIRVTGDYNADYKRYYIKNADESEKNAWLGMEAKGVRYVGHVEVRKPKLSFDDKQVLAVENLEDKSK
jgi:hypothetical protein